MGTTENNIEKFVQLDGANIQVFTGGSGPPIVILHAEEGNPGWMPYHEELSRNYTVFAPSLPGQNNSDRPPWVNSVTDASHFLSAFIDLLAGPQKPILMGFSLGGWLAAEIAALNPDRLKGLVLVGAMGIKPQIGEITEIMTISPQDVQNLSYYDQSIVPNVEELEADLLADLWINREMASRLGWKPYMHNPALPNYLKLIKLPSLIIWGANDAIVPLNSAELYHQNLVGSQLNLIDNCGHFPQNERPDEFLKLINAFLSSI